jgi:hypothetical protein
MDLFESPEKIGEMLDRKLHHGIVLRMQHTVAETVQRSGIARHGIQVVVKELVDHQDGAVGDLLGPVAEVSQQRFDDVLYANDPLQVMMRLHEKAPKPFLSAYGLREVQLMKYRELLFVVKDGNIVERDLINLHAYGN